MTGRDHDHDPIPDPATLGLESEPVDHRPRRPVGANRWLAARAPLLLELLIISLTSYVAWTGSTRALGSLIFIVWVSLSLCMALPHATRARPSEDS